MVVAGDRSWALTNSTDSRNELALVELVGQPPGESDSRGEKDRRGHALITMGPDMLI